MVPLYATGYGGLSISIEGPHRSDIDYHEAIDRKYCLHYSPHEPGIYILNVRFADEHVPGELLETNSSFTALTEHFHF